MVNIDITASGNAAGEIARVQAAIDALHGKTIEINVKVNQSGSLRDLQAFGRAADVSASAQERNARASERAAAGAREHERASDRAASSVRNHAASSERAAGAMGGVGDSSSRASGGLDRVGGSADRSSSSLGGFSRSGDTAGRSSRSLGDTVGGLGRALGGLGDGARGAARGLSTLGEASSLSNVLGTATSAVSMFGTAAAYSAAGSGILTAAVGALGAVGVGALGAVGVAAGAAGGAMAAFALDAHKDSQRFGATLEQMGKQAHLGAQFISEPMAEAMVGLGRALVTAEGQMTPAGMGIASSLREGFGTAAGVINRSSESIVEAAGTAAAGFARLTGEAAPGVEAFLSQLPSLTQGAVSGLSQITSEFGRSAGAIEGATPAFNRMMGAAGGLGAEVMKIGRGSMVPLAENMTSMLGGATAMATQLSPAIKPSMQAFTDLANAGMGAIGSLAPDIASFARAVSANSGGIQQAVGGIGKGMLGMGEAVANGVGMAGPSINAMGDAVQANKGDIGEIVGGALSAAGDVGNFIANTMGGANRFDSSRVMGGGAQLRQSMDQIGTTLGGGGPGLFGKQASGESKFDEISRTGGLMGMASRAMGGGGGAPAAAPPSLAGSPFPTVAPVPAANPFAPLIQNAQQAQTAIPSSMNTAMSQSRSAIQSANLAPAVQPGMKALTSAVQQASAPAAAAGGNVGAAIGGGVGQGITKTETITDKLVRRHVTLIEDLFMGAMDAHSPSRRFKKVGEFIPQGMAEGIGTEGRAALEASNRMVSDQIDAASEARRYRELTVRSPGAGPRRAEASERQSDVLSGTEKLEKFTGNADPTRFGTEEGDLARSVFDKQTFGWEAKPGVDITQAKSMAELNSMIQSPMSGKRSEQYEAMMSMQADLDLPGLSRNYQMFGARTQQNIQRNRPGAFNVAGAKAEHQARAKGQGDGAGLPENLSVGGSGAGGQSPLGRDRINIVRQAAGLGASSAMGAVQGLRAGAGDMQSAGGKLAEAGHAGYKKKDKQKSPSAAWAEFGSNSVAGLAGGFAGSTGVATGAVSSLAGAMQSVGNDRMLQAGYTWGENVVTGVLGQLKKADYTGAGLPKLESAAAMKALADTGLLKAGSGAFIAKMVGNAPSQVTLPKQSFTLNHNLQTPDGTMHRIATEVFLDNLGRVTDAVAVQAR